MTMFPMENKKKVPVFWWDGEQTFCNIQYPEETQEAKPENEEVMEEQEHGGEERETSSVLNQDYDHRLLPSILSAGTDLRYLQLQKQVMSATKIKSFPNPLQDLKKKGVDCPSSSLSFIPEPAPFQIYHRGQTSSAICVICGGCFLTGELLRSRNCGHYYCPDCFGIYIREKINEDLSNVNCPVSKCETLFGPNSCRGLIPEQVLERWSDWITESSVLARPVYVRCPFEWCGKWFVDDERGFKIRACPNCWKLYCVDCRVAWHMGKSCEIYKFELQLEMLLEKQSSSRRRQLKRGGGGGGGGRSDDGGLMIIVLD